LEKEGLEKDPKPPFGAAISGAPMKTRAKRKIVRWKGLRGPMVVVVRWGFSIAPLYKISCGNFVVVLDVLRRIYILRL
jgi:hypothetical protein